MANQDTEKIYQEILKFHPPIKKMIVDGLRQGFKFDIPVPEDFYPDVKVEERQLPGGQADVKIRALVYTPKVKRPPILIYIHGGGWTLESSDDYVLMHKKLASMAGVMIVAIDYRLAPEHPFPAGLEDCRAAYGWLRAHATEWGADPQRIAAGGDSAGGNLTPALALKLKEEGEPLPEALLCLCPLTDFYIEKYDSWRRLAFNGIVYDAGFLGYVRGAYANCDEWDHPLVSPIYGDLRGLPPTCIIGGEEDPLADDARAFAKKLQESEVKVDFKIYEHMPHTFYAFTDLIPQEQESLEQMTRFLKGVFQKK